MKPFTTHLLEPIVHILGSTYGLGGNFWTAGGCDKRYAMARLYNRLLYPMVIIYFVEKFAQWDGRSSTQ